MAYFADRIAGLTGTDARTRISIAKGLTSPYFTDKTGKKIARGVVQLDVLTGVGLDYGTHVTREGRINAANRINREYAARESVRTPAQDTTYQAQLHDSSSGAILPTSNIGIPKNVIIIGIAALGALMLILR